MSDDLITDDHAEGGSTRRRLLTGMGAAVAGGGLAALAGAQQAQAFVEDATYSSIDPVRVVDTRQSGGRISGGQTRTLAEDFGDSDDLNFAINLTVTSTKGDGYLAVYSADLQQRPYPYSSVNWQGANKTVANFNLVDGGVGGIKVYCSGDASTSTHFIIDVVGVFLTSDAPTPPAITAWKKRVSANIARNRTR